MLLFSLRHKLKRKGIELWITQMQDPVTDRLRKLDTGRVLLMEQLYPSVTEAVQRFVKLPEQKETEK